MYPYYYYVSDNMNNGLILLVYVLFRLPLHKNMKVMHASACHLLLQQHTSMWQPVHASLPRSGSAAACTWQLTETKV
jgi:hypothetical protein